MKRTLLLGGLILLLTVWRLEPSAQGGFEWNHWDIGESQDYATGKSALAVALDIIESSGWEVRFISARPGGGYAVVGRGPKGLHVPQPVVVPQNNYDYGSGSGSGTSSWDTTVACPGTHRACRVLPAGTYEKAIADKIGG